jgi:hypothetical protein
MLRRPQLGVSLAILAALATGGVLLPLLGAAQNQGVVPEIVASARLFPEIGPGVRALKDDSNGRYYILAAPATAISVYGPDAKRVGQIPVANSPGAKIVFAEDVDVDATDRIFVADRAANAVEIFKADGALDATIPVTAPTSVAALSGGEFAVASLRASRLVTIYNEQGKVVRSFGDPRDVASSADVNRYLNHGRLTADRSSFVYFAFTYLPDAIIRKYDRFGFSAYEISLPGVDNQSLSASRSSGVDILALARRNRPAEIKAVINAFGVDPVSQEVWAAIGDQLSHFGKDGALLASYRTATADGTRLEPGAILIEPGRILLAVDPLGVYEFARPDRQRSASIGTHQ